MPETLNRVLVVDDEPGMRAALEAHFLRRNWRVDTAANASEALQKFRRTLHPLVVTDIRMPGSDGFSVMREARALAPQTAVILLTAFASVPDAVTAMKGGACDYLVKPVAFEQLEAAAERILPRAHGKSCYGTNSDQAKSDRTKESLVGHAPLWLRALERARQAAASGADVLIEAESGTGKELVARLIHRLSPRREQAFVAVNCAAFPETLLESELFGYARGAFTGALAAKPGRFELANRGTLLLDEIGEMPLGLQPKLLRVLQEREFDRLGDLRAVSVDVRVVATTNRSHPLMVRQGTFRADLYYRLNVIPLALPPLRERREDISELAEHFLRLHASPGQSLHLAREFLERLEAHDWPGNVRELANCMRRAIALATGPEITAESLELGLEQKMKEKTDDRSLRGITDIPESEDRKILRPGVSLGDMERRLLEMTLDATGGNRSRAAELLGVSLRTVRNKIRNYGLPSWSSYVHH
jgi:DNA-binding NtrC family response regulator